MHNAPCTPSRQEKSNVSCKKVSDPLDETACRVHCAAMNTSEIIRARRAELGLSQRQLAERLNINTSTVWRWEHGKTNPDIFVLAFINSLTKGERS